MGTLAQMLVKGSELIAKKMLGTSEKGAEKLNPGRRTVLCVAQMPNAFTVDLGPELRVQNFPSSPQFPPW